MATTRVGIYRSYYGATPVDATGKPLPKCQWPQKWDHSWVVRWFGVDGNRYSKSFPTRKEADFFAESKQLEVRQNKADPPPDILLSQFIKEHEKLMRNQVARETLLDQMRALRMFESHIGAHIKLRSILPRHAESYIAGRLSSGVRIATVNKDIRTLKRIFNLAITPRGYLPPNQNPFASIRQRKHSLKSIRYVTPQEFHKLLAATNDVWWKTLLTVAYTTGARMGELIHLTWPDVDFGANLIRIAGKSSDASRPNIVSW